MGKKHELLWTQELEEPPLANIGPWVWGEGGRGGITARGDFINAVGNALK